MQRPSAVAPHLQSFVVLDDRHTVASGAEVHLEHIDPLRAGVRELVHRVGDEAVGTTSMGADDRYHATESR